MRSSVPIPGNPWPHEMSIEVADALNTLLELLWIREAWRLRPVGDDLPPRLCDPPPAVAGVASIRPEIDAWTESWPSVWRAVVHHAGIPADHSAFDELLTTADGSPERRELLTRIVGPSWRSEHGDAAFADGYSEWSAGQASGAAETHLTPLEEQPERIALDALIPAWRTGLLKIVTIPCTGEYTRVIGPHAMIMTDATRSDPDRYRLALGAFR